MNSDRDLFVGIDANAIIHRAFHAYPASLSTTSGLQVNAVYGFTAMLLQVLKQYDPKYLVCALDTKAPTFRHTKFAEYKAHRKPTDESLLAQMPLVEEVLKAFNIPIIKKEGYEADDILGTMAEWARSGKWATRDLDVYLVTGDRDFLQLIGGNVYSCLPAGSSFRSIVAYDADKTFEKYGYMPSQVVDFKAMVGDASDNIPGIKGVGEKSGKTLLAKYGTLDKIYENLSDLSERQQKLFTEGVEQAEFSRELAAIKTDVDLTLSLEDCLLRDFDEDELVYTFKKFEFKSLISKLPKSINGKSGDGSQLGMFSTGSEISQAESEGGVELTDEPEAFMKGFSDAGLKMGGYISADESESGDPFAFWSYVDNFGKQFMHFGGDWDGFTEAHFRETYFFNLEDFVSQNHFAADEIGELLANTVDLRLLAHLLSSGKKSYNLSSLIFDYASKNAPEKVSMANIARSLSLLPEVIEGIKKAMEEIKIADYSADWLKKVFKKKNIDGEIYYEILKSVEYPVALILAEMENRGVAVDRKVLVELDKDLKRKIKKVEKAIYEDIGHEFNLNSPKQLSDVLYMELGMPEKGFGKKSRSTREEILEEMKDFHPSIPKVLEYRELSKVHGTYVKPFIEIISEMHAQGKECVINTDFKQMGSSSGRFSSINPNMQNIPIKSDWGEKVRRAFVPRKGFKFVGADYSQIEFRVMADISEDPALLVDFNAGKDIHSATAARILDKPIEKVAKKERALGKTMNFAVLFGQTAYGLSRLLKVDQKQAAEYIDEYFENYKGVKEYIEKAKQIALDTGYVQSMLGRTRYISGLSSRNFNVKSAAIREAINMPIQGGEADIMKLAMIEIDKMIKKDYKESAFMLLQVHDELIFEVKEGVVDSFMKDVEKIMKGVVKLKVPLEVHTSSGDNMAQLK